MLGRAPSVKRAAPWSAQIQDGVRGLASGFLVGIPVVFTVDSWWLGDQLSPVDSLLLVLFAYVLTLAAVYWIGFRRGVRKGWEHGADAVEALALAMIALLIVFWALGQLGPGRSIVTILGRVAVASSPVALGIAIANHFLPRDASRYDPDPGDATAMRQTGFLRSNHTFWIEIAAAIAGAGFLCLSIVPLDDLSAIASNVPLGNLPWIVMLSLVVSYVIVYAAGFAGETRRHQRQGPLHHPITETILAYVVAVVVAWGSLMIFGRLAFDTPGIEVYGKTVLLALPASMAAAAGRLAV
jgi:putative integral membrane protein (TIGR02587 family)